jgi:hypothetical protein
MAPVLFVAGAVMVGAVLPKTTLLELKLKAVVAVGVAPVTVKVSVVVALE